MNPEGSERCPRCGSKEIGLIKPFLKWQCGSFYNISSADFVQSILCEKWMLEQKVKKLEQKVKNLSEQLDIEQEDAEWLWNEEKEQ